MKTSQSEFSLHDALHDLHHYLPAQAPLKDFIHHNTLHAFQDNKFEVAIRKAAKIFGYQTTLPLSDFRSKYASQEIREDILKQVIVNRKGSAKYDEWREKMVNKPYETAQIPRIGALRNHWKKLYHVNIDAFVYPVLFRVVCSYLDQGISIWNFPIDAKGFLASIRELEKNSFSSFFRTERPKKLLMSEQISIESLLEILVGDTQMYKQYLFDQQFGHQGWSGIVATIETQPQSLLDTKGISLEDFIVFELLLEIDALDYKFGEIWAPLSNGITPPIPSLFEDVPSNELSEVMLMWQEAFEWSYYDAVLKGIQSEKSQLRPQHNKSFQALFCIDDRECSLRRYLESEDANCETFGTPGFFGVEFYYQPEGGKFYTKHCPAPVTPQYLIKEQGNTLTRARDLHINKHSHGLVRGWLISQTLGFFAGIRLFLNIFMPRITPATSASFLHMDQQAMLTIEHTDATQVENGLQIGFNVEEMTTRVANVLKSIGLVQGFAPIVYVVGHGSSSTNNTHFAGYDCGACSGRPGSVNARVFSYMANHAAVRQNLAAMGIVIPETTQFVGALHDTTRDDIFFYDADTLPTALQTIHQQNTDTFAKALDLNAKERSRRLVSIDTHLAPAQIHEKVKLRSVSLFEPRPELNHATNTLCIIGRRTLTDHLFLDRRAFMNSYDYRIDPEGNSLFNILKAAAPVCGGINLEYFFSRVDNEKLGAGTKLPHNVMGLIGVANGIDGDLRPGLPSQMIEVHDPLRLMMIVEQFPEVVLTVIQRDAATYEWFIHEWVHLIVVHPEAKTFHRFTNGKFQHYEPLLSKVETADDLMTIIETHEDNIPVYLIP